MIRAGICSLLGILALGGCGATSAIYSGPAPKALATIIEGYSRFWGAFSERAEITSVDRLAEGGIARAALGNVTRAQVEPGDRCVQLEIKSCTVGSCGESTVCAFADYFIGGQHVQLRAGSLRLDKTAAASDGVVNGTIQIEVSAPGFATKTRRINMSCGSAIRGQASNEEHQELLEEGIPVARLPVPPRDRMN